MFSGGKGMPPGGIGPPGPGGPPGGIFGGGKGIGGMLRGGPPRPMKGGGIPGIPVQVSFMFGSKARKFYLAGEIRAGESLGLPAEGIRPLGSGSSGSPAPPHYTRP